MRLQLIKEGLMDTFEAYRMFKVIHQAKGLGWNGTIWELGILVPDDRTPIVDEVIAVGKIEEF
jgi:hypothetical protein